MVMRGEGCGVVVLRPLDAAIALGALLVVGAGVAAAWLKGGAS
jgi:3-oxoacyl-(acyl-carrier-protein) synthase